VTNAASVLKLFQVTRKYRNPALSRLKNFGDNYGEVYESSELVVSSSTIAAIEEEWVRMEQEKKTTWQRVSDIRSGVIPKSKLPIHEPKTPVEKEKWRAREITIPGYTISINKTD